MKVVVPVQICTEIELSQLLQTDRSSSLAPESVHSVGVFVTVGIDHGKDVEIETAEKIPLQVAVLDQLLNTVKSAGDGNPFTGMASGIDKHCFFLRVRRRFLGDFNHFQRTILVRVTDGNDLHEILKGSSQTVQVLVNVRVSQVSGLQFHRRCVFD